MPFQRGTATDYRDLLDMLDKFITTDSVIAVAIDTAGTGYVAGETLSVAGGTVENSMVGKIEVLTVGGSGEILTVRVYDAGAYSVNPTLSANAVTGGSGSSAAMDLTMLTAYTHLFAVAVNAGGTNYVVGDTLTVLGGTAVDSKVATMTVLTLGGSDAVASVAVDNVGVYSVNPSTTANAVTGGSGSGATIDLTMVAAQWAQRIKEIRVATGPMNVTGGAITDDGSNYSVTDIVTLADSIPGTSKADFEVTQIGGSGEVLGIVVDDPGDYDSDTGGSFPTTGGGGTGLEINPVMEATRDEYLWEGEGTAGNPVFIGAASHYTVSVTQEMWLLRGYTGWTEGNDWLSQPGVSPSGSYMLLQASSMDFWIAVNVRRVIVVVNVGGDYHSAYLGLLDPYGTESEIPYPLFICGTSDQADEAIGQAALWMRGPADPTALVSSESTGPGWFRDGDQTWNKVYNKEGASSISPGDVVGYCIYPCARASGAGILSEDSIVDLDTPRWEDCIPANRIDTPDAYFMPSPDSGGDIYLPIPCIMLRSQGAGTHKAIGECIGLFWVSAMEGLATEDTITAESDVYKVFQMGANSLSYAHFAVRED